jgi:hypothetical protein
VIKNADKLQSNLQFDFVAEMMQMRKQHASFTELFRRNEELEELNK